MSKEELLTIYVNLVLEMFALPTEAKYGIDQVVSNAYHAYIAVGGTNAEALAAIRKARGEANE